MWYLLASLGVLLQLHPCDSLRCPWIPSVLQGIEVRGMWLLPVGQHFPDCVSCQTILAAAL